jgi:hypothetical protein
MKITQSQLNKIVKEELTKVKEGTYYPGRAVGGFSDRDADNAIAAATSQIRELIEDAYETAQRDPSHQDKGEGQAMANLVHFIDEMYDMYGSGDVGKEF